MIRLFQGRIKDKCQIRYLIEGLIRQIVGYWQTNNKIRLQDEIQIIKVFRVEFNLIEIKICQCNQIITEMKIFCALF